MNAAAGERFEHHGPPALGAAIPGFGPKIALVAPGTQGCIIPVGNGVAGRRGKTSSGDRVICIIGVYNVIRILIYNVFPEPDNTQYAY